MQNEFEKLFKGLDRAYGQYIIDPVNVEAGSKAGGKAKTIQNSVTTELWEAHLKGEASLGIVPITDDNLSYFGAIDIDVYELDFNELEKSINELKLPVIICMSKSGGAHLYVFIKGGQPSTEVRAILASYAVAIGYPGVEIFPKQDTLAGPDDVGNWINMPYFGDTRKAWYNGKLLTVEQFIERAKAVAVDELIHLAVSDDLKGAPPCLQILAGRGIPEGTRNEALFNFAVLAKFKGDVITAEYNAKYLSPPLPMSEVIAIERSVGRKDYFYKCKQQPIKDVCDKNACRKCEFGIGGSDSPGIAIEALDKICSIPPTWIVQVSGKRMRIDTEELVNQGRFARKCLETVNFLPPTVKQGIWTQVINKLMETRRDIEAPPDAGAEGQFLYHLEQFCTVRAPANSVDELLLGKPWHEDGRTYFRSADLIKYLDMQHFKEFKGNQVYAVLRHRIEGVEHHEKNLKGKFTNCWSVPEFNKQEEEFNVPRVDTEEF